MDSKEDKVPDPEASQPTKNKNSSDTTENKKPDLEASQLTKDKNSFDDPEDKVPEPERFQLTHVLPVRYVFVLLGFFGFFTIYTMRVNLSVAIVGMVKADNISDDLINDTTYIPCPELIKNDSISARPTREGDFEWDALIRGRVLGAFFYGYALTQIPGGVLSVKYGAKRTFAIGMLVCSVFTLLSPIAAKWNYWALVAARIIQGLGQGVAYPSMNTLIAQWSPTMERSRTGVIIFTGGYVGTVCVLAMSGFCCDQIGWEYVFYITGALGLIWLVPWMLLVSERPDVHPHITKEELSLILKGRPESKSKPQIPWKSILTSVPFWALAYTHIGMLWGFNAFLLLTPTYFKNVLHFNTSKTGVISAVPSMCLSIVSLCVSLLADKLRQRGKLSISFIRKLVNTIGALGGAAGYFIIAFIPCKPVPIIALFCLAMGLTGFGKSGYMVTHVDMSPDFAGTLYGITNFFATFTGFIVPKFSGWILSYGNTEFNWAIIYSTTAGILCSTGVVYVVFASAELQPWGVAK